jgi:dTDP-4-dehydrorhamnose 3,5-epimerase
MSILENESRIPGVIIKSLRKFTDSRGWLIELFRDDELPEGFKPVMGYVSLTHPGVARGPHEHRDQTDGFAFLNGKYEVTLWENRPDREHVKQVILAGEDNPLFLVVPPGVVHAYRNVGESGGTVLNFPDQLYAGRGKKEQVDEIRHEEIDSEFKL